MDKIEKGKTYTINGISKTIVNIYKKNNVNMVDFSYDGTNISDEFCTLDNFIKWLNSKF